MLCVKCDFDLKKLVEEGKISFCPKCGKENKLKKGIKIVEKNKTIDIEGEEELVDNLIKKISLKKKSERQHAHLEKARQARGKKKKKEPEPEEEEEEEEESEEEVVEVKKVKKKKKVKAPSPPESEEEEEEEEPVRQPIIRKGPVKQKFNSPKERVFTTSPDTFYDLF